MREWAWLALRADIVAAPLQALEYLQPWTQEGSPYLRRFACEGRARAACGPHVALFKRQPELAEAMLEALADDPERYVQDWSATGSMMPEDTAAVAACAVRALATAAPW